ncbi:2OG-Fe(II) oxygenase [Nostoc sp. CENA67]|uniref:2OG-Fe(II) oxygenase n=1 Tax=Amazonocrinis nigriterrae CENA67 TaxID=2794033 RepID=A0A8J7HZQ5_9NOST|nr:2OG-Fe(II) oxygenase [Amazonocrinis nigriterrae]MBH8566388.1 2OG-Fe(II) oxygenase [Amazonocrinis nigriterrae CENA67]
MHMVWQKIRRRVIKKINQIPFVQHQADIAYQIAVENHKNYLPTISQDDLKLVEKIKNEGVVITSLDDLGILSSLQLIDSAKNLMVKMAANNSIEKNQFVIHATSPQLMEHPQIFLWGLEQRLLNIVEHYIELPIAYHGAYFRRDIANKLEIGSRLWHIDPEDRKVLKIIVYLNDIGESEGPFQYIPQPLTAKVAQSLKYTYGYIKNSTMQKVISPTHYRSCIGNSGTVVFASTGNIFHRGKPPEASDRYTIFFDYTSRRKQDLNYINFTLPHKDLVLLSQNLSEQQQQCLFWQKNLK